MELIDRRPLIEKLKNAIALGHKIETFVGELEAVLEDVENMPIIDAVSEWIPFEIRPTDDEEREYFKSDTILCGELPDEGDEVLVSKGRCVWQDTFESDELGAWLDSYGEIEEGMAWMPLPKPYEETDHE